MENNNITIFFGKFLEIIPNSSKPYQEFLEEWLPDNPPITTSFAFLGHEIAKKFEHTNQKTKEDIFRLVEEGISHTDENLSTAVATGLIEAMIASKYKNIREDTLKLFGENSLYHAKCWLNLI